MPLIFRDLKGSNLTPAEADENIRTLDQRIADSAQALQEQMQTLQPDLGVVDRDDLLLTVDQRFTYPARNPMGTLTAIDVTVRGNVKVVDANTTLSWITPLFASGQTWDLELSNSSASPVTVTLPQVYSTQQQALVTSFVLPAGGRSDLFFRYDGERVRMTGEPLVLPTATGSALPTETAFSTTLPFDGNRAMARHFITDPVAFTMAPGGARGGQLSLELVANGTNIPTFSTDFFKLEGSQDFSNVNGVVNIVSLWSDGTRAYYAISYNAAATATAPVTPVAPARTTSPTVSGGTAPGATLTRTLGTYTGTPTPTVTGIWQQSTDGGTTWADISGSTGATFGPTVDTRRYRWGNEIGTNSEGSTTPANSNVIVTTNVLAAPVNTAAPTAPTTATVGNTVTGTAGTWTGNPTPTLAYLWQRDQDGPWIDSAFTTLAAALTPAGIWRLRVTGTNSEGSVEAFSGSLTLSEAAAGGTAVPIGVSSSQNVTNEGNETYAATAQGTSNTAHILATKSLTGDGWVEAQRPNDTDSSSYVCLDVSSSQTLGYASNDFLAQCNAAGLIQYATNATSPTSTGYTLPPGEGSRFRVRKAGSQVVLETTVDNGVEWTLRHTYALAPAATLYAHFYTTFSTFARKLYQPRVEGFA